MGLRKKVKQFIPSIFFGTPKPKEKTFAEKMEEAMPAMIKLIPQLRALLRRNDPDQPQINTDGQMVGQMYDFYKNYDDSFNGSHGFIGGTFDVVTAATPEDWENAATTNPNNKKDKRIAAKPVDVQKELEVPPTPPSIADLDAKIALMEDKALLSNQRFVAAQIKGMCQRLKNRKKYAEHRQFFETFPCTTDEKIDDLIRKYQLVVKETELFIPAFPKEAIDVMKAYAAVTMKICGEKPVFYVIAEEKDFQAAFKKLDPILLVQSPFGNFWQILGAWDKEMILLSEL